MRKKVFTRDERLLEEVEVEYEYGNSDLAPNCIRLGRSKDGRIHLYYWGSGEPGQAILSSEAAEELWNQLEELLEMNDFNRAKPEGGS